MRILHVYRTYFPDTQGGLEEVIRQIAINTKQFDVETRIFALSKSPYPESISREEGLVIRAKKHFEIASCSISLTAKSLFREHLEWADIIHFHFPWPFGDYLSFLVPAEKPSVLTYHSDIVRQRFLFQLYKPVMRKFLASMDRVVCTSPNYFATSDVLYDIQEKVDVIPIGLDRTTYPKTTESAELAATYTNKPYFLFIGVLRYYKGLHILLDAMPDAPYDFIIVGSGPTESALKDQATKLGLANVHFTGHVSDTEKVALIQASRGVVFPSYLRSEAFGVTLLEGAMFGRPLISTEIGSGTSHVNIHDQTGLVVAPGSSRALRASMDRLFYNPMLAERMGRNAHKRYSQFFTGKVMGAKYHKLYREVLGLSNKSQRLEAVKIANSD